MWESIVDHLFPIICSLFLGSWSDNFGRKYLLYIYFLFCMVQTSESKRHLHGLILETFKNDLDLTGITHALHFRSDAEMSLLEIIQWSSSWSLLYIIKLHLFFQVVCS